MSVKSVLLASAAGVLAVSTAQAADLPVAPEPIDYVRVCDAFGESFYYIPGTDTCISVTGRVRAEYRFFDADPVTRFRDEDSTQFRARGYIYMDARTNTEFGLLRAYNEIYLTYDAPGGTAIDLENSFIQFGGFTFGRTQSFYDFIAYPTYASVFTPQLSDQRQNLGAYTFAFGNGASATLSLESADERRIGIGGTSYGGTKYPDLVANVRIDQGWGSAQVMGAVHQVWPAYNATGTTPDSELGFAVGGGVSVNLPFGTDVTANLSGAYSRGAVAYATSSANGPDIEDAVVDAAGDLELTSTWSMSGGFGFAFTPTVSAAIQGGYLDYRNDAAAMDDFRNYDLQGNVSWTPVDGLLLGVGVEYRYVDVDTASTFDDEDLWVSYFRAERTF